MRILTAGIMLLALLASAMAPVDAATVHRAPAHRTQALQHISVGLSAFQDVISIYVGIQEGFFQKQGIAIDIQKTDWPGSNQLLVGKHVDLDTTSDADVVLQNAQGNDTTLAFPLYYFAGGGLMYDPHKYHWTTYATFLKQTGGNRAAALRKTLLQAKGKKVGVSSGGAEYATFIGMVKAAGLKPGDFQIVNLAQEDLPPALLSGSIDIMIAGIPQRLVVLHHGFATLTDQTALPSTIAQCGYGAHRSWLKTHRALAAKFQKVVFQTMAFIKQHPNIAFPIMSQRLKDAGTVESASDMARVWDNMEYFVHGKQWYRKNVMSPSGKFYWKPRFQAVVNDLTSSGKVKSFNVPLSDLNYALKIVPSVK